MADVGLVGYPSVGKSSIIAQVSAARPEIAAYHFTTLSPVLGVVRLDEERSFVLADIPGLIEGAHEGVGLGHDFLRHVERTKVLLHIVDVAGVDGRDPIEDFDKINTELAEYSERLVAMTNFDNDEALYRFQLIWKRLGIDEALKEKGVQEGQSVRIRDMVFDYKD